MGWDDEDSGVGVASAGWVGQDDDHGGDEGSSPNDETMKQNLKSLDEGPQYLHTYSMEQLVVKA